MNAPKPPTIEDVRSQVVADCVQAIVCMPIMAGGDLVDVRLVMEAVLVSVCETLERIAPGMAEDFDLDQIVTNARAAARQRRLVREAAE